MANVESRSGSGSNVETSNEHFKNALFATAESVGVAIGAGFFPPAILLLFVTGSIAIGETVLGIYDRAKYALGNRQASPQH